MPFLRVIRDKRGYETTYLMHWYREGARQHSRILYVFRSPGGVRVGREPLEPEVQQQIEAQHPDICFDWKVVRENQQVVETAAEPRRRRPPRLDESEPPPPPPPRPAETPQAAGRPSIPPRIQGDTPDAQIAFLAQIYVSLRERIAEQAADADRQETLRALTERLNPAAWTDADQITTGLQDAAEALERLSLVFAKRRRRGRKKPRPVPLADGGVQTLVLDGSADAESLDEPDAPDPPDADPSDPGESSLL